MSKNIRKRFFTGVIVFLSLLSFPGFRIKSSAGSFTHSHSDSCYEVKTGTCRDHKITLEHTTVTLHCFTCGEMKTFNRTIYWDNCNQNLTARRDCGYVDQCSSCGGYRQNRPGEWVAHSYSYKALVCTLSEGEEEGSITLSSDTPGWTNKDVTLTANYNKKAGNVSVTGFSFSGGSAWGNTCIVSENGTYYVTATANDGRSTEASICVSNIDKAGPVIIIQKSTEEWTEAGLDIIVSAEDNESGVYSITVNGTELGNGGNMHISKNGTVLVNAVDNAGNVSKSELTITNIGKDPEIVRKEKEAAEKAAAEKAAAEKAAAEKAAAEKAAAEKAAAEKAVAEKAAAEKAAAEKLTSDKILKANVTSVKTSRQKADTENENKEEKEEENAKTIMVNEMMEKAKNEYFASLHNNNNVATTDAGSEKEELSAEKTGQIMEGGVSVVSLGMSDSKIKENNKTHKILNLSFIIIGSLLIIGALLYALFLYRQRKIKK